MEFQTIEQNATTQSGELLQEATRALSEASAYVIDSPDMYELAAGELMQVKKRAKAINELRLSLTRPIDEAKKRIMDLFTPAIERYTQAERTIKDAMLVYDNEQERIRKQKEAEARKAREEQERQAREAARAAEEAARAARIAAQEEKNAEAKKAAEEAARQAEQAAAQKAAEQQAIVAAPVLVADTKPKVKGVSRRSTYSAEIVDMLALVKAVAEGKQPIELLQPDMKVINGMARSLKHALDIPGVKVVENKDITSRGK